MFDKFGYNDLTVRQIAITTNVAVISSLLLGSIVYWSTSMI